MTISRNEAVVNAQRTGRGHSTWGKRGPSVCVVCARPAVVVLIALEGGPRVAKYGEEEGEQPRWRLYEAKLISPTRISHLEHECVYSGAPSLNPSSVLNGVLSRHVGWLHAGGSLRR